MLLWLTVIEMKIIGEVVELKKRFDLGKEDGGGDLIKDDFDKYDDDDCDDCGDNTSWNVSIINFESFKFPFSIR